MLSSVSNHWYTWKKMVFVLNLLIFRTIYCYLISEMSRYLVYYLFQTTLLLNYDSSTYQRICYWLIMLISFLNTRFNSGEIVELMFAVVAGENRATYPGVRGTGVGCCRGRSVEWVDLDWSRGRPSLTHRLCALHACTVVGLRTYGMRSQSCLILPSWSTS